jgi:hypothetical protein
MAPRSEISPAPERRPVPKRLSRTTAQACTGHIIGGYGVDMSTPQKSLKYKAITPIA